MKKKTKKLLTIILSIVLTIGIITAGVFLLKPKDSKRVYPTYHIGSIDESGEFIESDDAIYSDLFECQGLTVKPDFTSNVEYSIYFYYFDETFATATETLEDAFTEPVDESYRYARILIMPDKEGKTSEEYKIWFWNIPSISNDLEISVSTNQPALKNLAEVKEENAKWSSKTSFTGWNQLEEIDVSNMKTLAIVCESGVDNLFNSVEYQFDKNSTTATKVLASNKLTSKFITIDVSSSDTIYISVKSDLVYKIYKFN